MRVSAAGKAICVSEVHSANALSPISSRLPGSVTETSSVQK